MTLYKKNRVELLLLTIILLIIIRIAGCKLSDRDLLAPPKKHTHQFRFQLQNGMMIIELPYL